MPEVDPVVSATVLLRPEGRGEPGARAGRGAASSFFTAAGFEVGPRVAGSFAITGPRSLFERTFGETLEDDSHGSLRTGAGSRELALTRVPDRVAQQLEAVAFSRPPDFGPTSF